MDNTRTSSFTPPANITGDRLVIEGEEFTRLVRVLRKQAGDPLRVVDGRGTEHDVEIERVERRALLCRITDRRSAPAEPMIRLTLGVALLKNSSRYDILVEKATELGVASIVPLMTERTVAAHARSDRWIRIAVSAMVQSGRAILPDIAATTPLQDFLTAAAGDSLRLIAHEQTEDVLLSEVPVRENILVAIGPEGGFSNAEVQRARAEGFQTVGLGPRRLRTETAAIAAAALILSGRRNEPAGGARADGGS